MLISLVLELLKGCDASIMIKSSKGDDERHSADDITLSKDAFGTILAVKKAVDQNPQCVNKVSCADIMALAARDSVTLVLFCTLV
jgi:peroxidase